MKTKKGFALPTVMISSVVMLTVLLAGLVYTSSTNVTVRDQYYDQLAREAAESGINLLIGCIRASTPPSGAFTPSSTSCANNASQGGKSNYVLDTTTAGTRIKTTFSATSGSIDAAGYYTITSTGTTELYRTSSTSSPIRTLSKTLSLRIQNQSLFPNTSSSGSVIVCGLVNSEAYCWGANQDGRLGNGTLDAAGQVFEADTDNQLGLYNAGNPVVTKVVRPGDVVDLNGSSTSAPNAANSEILDHEVAIAAGGEFACAITTSASDPVNAQGQYTDRKVVCWGDTKDGQLGNNNDSGAYIPYPVTAARRWDYSPPTYPQYPSNQIVANGGAACILTNQHSSDTDGNTWCWGSNNQGQIGQGSTTQAYYKVAQKVYSVNGSSSGVTLKYINTSSDGRAICGILKVNNKAVCWGRNEYGNIGNDTDGSINSTYLKITLPSIVVNTSNQDLYVADISPGGSNAQSTDHTCAVSKTNSNSPNTVGDKIYCWGANESGQIGRGTVNTSHYRKANLVDTIQDLSGNTTTDYTATRVVSANQTTCAIVSVRFSGAPLNETNYHTELVCWGSNGWGEMGVGQAGTTQGSITFASTYSRPTVVPFFTGKTIKSMDGGAFRFCAVVGYSNYCWGRDYAGQVGDGHVDTAEYTPSKSIFLEPDFVGLTY